MVFIREIHFSPLVQKLLRICVWLETDPQSAHHTGVQVSGRTGSKCPWCDLLQLLLLLQLERRPAACIVIRPLAECNVLSAPSVFTARRYAMSDYAMVALCLCVCSSQVAAEPITVVCKAARVYVPIIGGVVWTFYRVLCKNGGTDRRQRLKPTPIHAKCLYLLCDMLEYVKLTLWLVTLTAGFVNWSSKYFIRLLC